MRTISSMKPEYLLPSLELVEKVFTDTSPKENSSPGVNKSTGTPMGSFSAMAVKVS